MIGRLSRLYIALAHFRLVAGMLLGVLASAVLLLVASCTGTRRGSRSGVFSALIACAVGDPLLVREGSTSSGRVTSVSDAGPVGGAAYGPLRVRCCVGVRNISGVEVGHEIGIAAYLQLTGLQCCAG